MWNPFEFRCVYRLLDEGAKVRSDITSVLFGASHVIGENSLLSVSNRALLEPIMQIEALPVGQTVHATETMLRGIQTEISHLVTLHTSTTEGK